MADKSQTINIVYKFNTSEIDKAQQSLNRVNQASNKLQSDAAKGGSAFQKEFDKSGKTINDMQRALTGLRSALETTSKTADPKRYSQLSNEFRNIKTQMD